MRLIIKGDSKQALLSAKIYGVSIDILEVNNTETTANCDDKYYHSMHDWFMTDVHMCPPYEIGSLLHYTTPEKLFFELKNFPNNKKGQT